MKFLTLFLLGLTLGLTGCGGSSGSGSAALVSGDSGDTASSSSSSFSSSSSSSSEISTALFSDVTWGKTLPVLHITTEGKQDIVIKGLYLNADFQLEDIDGDILNNGTLEIRGRGNSTWDMEKKPYRLKLTDSSELLGMPANRHWVLLANYADKSLLRNNLAFYLSEKVGMQYTVRSRHVELMLNNEYMGVYQLAEHVRVSKNRVDIPELKITDTDPDKITGGYFIEIDSRYGEDYCFPADASPEMVFCLVSPETLNEPGWEPHKAYITDYLKDTENALYSQNFDDDDLGYRAYMDVESTINYYLVNELFKNVDGNLRLSTFMFKPRDGKLTFGPLWDFDIAIGNVNYGGADTTDGWHIRNAPWFTQLFSDNQFNQEVQQRWQMLKNDNLLPDLIAYIDQRAAHLEEAQQRNFVRWDILGTWVWPNRVVTGSYEEEITELKKWLTERYNWMDENL